MKNRCSFSLEGPVVRFHDFSLLIATIIAALVGVFLPSAAESFGFVPLYGMMALLYVSFIPLRFNSLIAAVQRHFCTIIWFVIARMLLFPSAVYWLFRLIMPDYALAGMLLAGAATAVVTPFMAHLLKIDVAFTTVLTVASSFLLPFTLPFIIMFWVGTEITISPLSMVFTLVQMILLPAGAAFLTQKFLPGLIKPVQRQTFFWGLTITCCSTLIIFSNYSDSFFSTPEIIWIGLGGATAIALLLGAFSCIATWRFPLDERLSFILCSLLLNLVLIVVLCNEFFGPREAITAVMYTIPFYATIIPLRYWIVKNGTRSVSTIPDEKA